MFKLWSTFWANRARKRKEEKQRHSQHIEDTFSERLASRSVAGKRRIDVGFTSQQNLNEENEDGERRVTFSRFLRLWRGLRNSKRKPTNDEPRKDVVFTIPTEDVFPRTRTRQQTYHQDAITHTTGINSHEYGIHQVTYDITEDCSNHNLHHLEEDELNSNCKNETFQVKVINEISSKQNGSTETEQTIVEKQSDTPGRKTSEEKYIKGKEDGKSFSKESDVDSGCGSSCHEIATEPPITHAQLNVSSLVFQAQKMEATENRFLDKVTGIVFDSKELENTETSSTSKVLQETKTEIALRDPNEEWSEFQKSQFAANDSFEELIKLARDGMSTLARKRVRTDGNRNKISDCSRATTSVDNLSRTHDTSTNTDAKTDENLDLNAESQLSLDACKVDSGVKFASSTSSCLNDTDNTSKTKILRCTDTPNQSDTSIDKTLDATTTETHTEKSMEQSLHCAITENHPGIDVNEISHTTADDPPDRLASSTAAVEIPTITLETELGAVEHLSKKTSEKNQVSCAGEDLFHHDTPVNNDQCAQGNFHEEIDKSNNGDMTNSKQSHLVRLRESLLNNSQTITEKSARPKSMVLPSTNGNNEVDKTIYGLKVTSLETLNLPSQGQPPENAGRIRSFSATIRRKLSFRERGRSDEMDIDGQIEANNKKLKGFRSFRMNRKKKTKALRSDEASQSIGSHSDSNKYVSTIDKIFHENTGSAIFSDVPFTIPEISE